jgi:hypothetical protein
MKRILPITIVALIALVPVGVVLAAKSAKVKATASKVTHRSAKQKAANEKLTAELLEIMEATDNKATFAACLECLAQLKPQREVVVPAIIRKADKMGWLRPEAADDWAMIGEYVVKFLPGKSTHVHGEPNNLPYAIQSIQYPCPCPPPVMPTPSYSAAVFQTFQPAPVMPNPVTLPVCTPPGPCVCLPSTCTTPAMPATMPRDCVCQPATCVTPAMPSTMPTNPCPLPAYNVQLMPCQMVQSTAVKAMPSEDHLTSELLKIIEETESKVTFAIAVETLHERCDNWDHVIPVLIRKADKMGWLKVNDKSFGEKFAENLMELIAEKARKSDSAQDTKVGPTCPCPPGCTCPASVSVGVGEVITGSAVIGSGACLTGTIAAEALPMPRPMEVLPMPRVTEEPKPSTKVDQSLFDRYIGWGQK